MTVNTCQAWFTGPENSIDRLISLGHDAAEIAYRLGVPRWLVVERFAIRPHFEEAAA